MNMDFDGFPNIDNIDVQKTQTNFDYNLWGANTQLFLSHIDAKFTSSYEHVLKFNTKAEKDAYFKTNAPIKLNTSFLIKPDGTIRLQIPYVNLINYNYLVAVYPDIPALDYNPANARNEYYYFIEDCKMISPNTTELKLTLDVWNTYIDDITIEYMMLERGHYPMTLTTVEEYLANPLAKRVGLTTVDVNYGDLVKVNINHSKNLMEGTKWMIVATTSDPLSMPKLATNTQNETYMNQNGLIYMAIDATNWTTFCANVAAQRPQFFQTIKGIIVGYDGVMAVDRTTPHQFCDVNFYYLTPSSFDITYKFTKEDFGFDDKYKDLVKLYTYPYSVVEWVDVNGVVRHIKYEDLVAGQFCLKLFQNLCISNPSVTAIVMGVGGSNAELGGNYHQQEYMCEIPLATAILNQTALNDYLMRTHFTRIQEQANINLASDISKRENDTMSANVDLSIAASAEQVEITNNYMDQMFTNNANKQKNFLAYQQNIALAQKNANLDQMLVNNMVMNAGTAVGGITSSNPAGAALSMLLNSANVIVAAKYNDENYKGMWFSGCNDTYPINTTAFSDSVEAPTPDPNKPNGWILPVSMMDGINAQLVNNGIIFASTDRYLTENYNSSVNDRNNQLIRDTRDNNYATAELNRTQTKANSEAAIQNAINQAALGNNISHGVVNDVYNKFIGSQYTIQYHIKTQDDHAIKLAGDQFLRYGYMFNGEVDFTTFLIMPEFTYWKVSDVWMNSDKVNSKVINTLTDILKEGVTVWGKGYYNPVPEPEKSSYGILTYIKNGETISYEITEESDFMNLCEYSSYPENIPFSFDTIHRNDVIGWKFNTSPNTLVPDIIPNYFLRNFPNLNSDIQFPDNVTEIGNYFLAGEGIFNSNIIFNDNLTKIDDRFLYYQKNFNKPISSPNITTIGEKFLYACKSFNQPISLPNVISIGDYFLYGCDSFNQPISFPKITTINNGFLMFCKNFNQTIDLPNVTTIGDGFLASTPSFNQPISLPKVTTIGNSFKNSFADDYYNFNQTIDLPNVTTIGDSFLYECKYFNQPISLPNVTTIGDYFLAHCYSFNQPISLPKVISIGDRFMYEWSSFNQDFTFSNTLQHVGDYCFHITLNSTIMPDYTLTFTINCNPDVFVNNTEHPHGRSESFYWYNFDLGGPLGPNPNLPSITVNGIYADEFKTRFPNFMYGSYPDYYGRNFI